MPVTHVVDMFLVSVPMVHWSVVNPVENDQKHAAKHYNKSTDEKQKCLHTQNKLDYSAEWSHFIMTMALIIKVENYLKKSTNGKFCWKEEGAEVRAIRQYKKIKAKEKAYLYTEGHAVHWEKR